MTDDQPNYADHDFPFSGAKLVPAAYLLLTVGPKIVGLGVCPETQICQEAHKTLFLTTTFAFRNFEAHV